LLTLPSQAQSTLVISSASEQIKHYTHFPPRIDQPPLDHRAAINRVQDGLTPSFQKLMPTEQSLQLFFTLVRIN